MSLVCGGSAPVYRCALEVAKALIIVSGVLCS